MFVIKTFSKNLTVQYVSSHSIPITVPDGYKLAGIIGESINYQFVYYGADIDEKNIFFTLKSASGSSVTANCSFKVLFIKNFKL